MSNELRTMVEPILVELRTAEEQLLSAYQMAGVLLARGHWTETLRAALHAQRDDLYATEMDLYRVLRGVVAQVSEERAAALPVPAKFPDLPHPPSGVSGGIAGTGRSLGGAGLGYPAIVWAGAALVAVLALAATVGAIIIASQVVTELTGIARHVISVRSNTQRYQMQLQTWAACMASGKGQGACGGIPGPPQEPTAPPGGAGGWAWWKWALAGAGALAVVGGGIWAYLKFSKRGGGPQALGALPSAAGPVKLHKLGRGRVGGRRGGYAMEVRG